MTTSFELLADPTRRRLLDALREGERCVGELVERLGMSQPAVSKQLRVLREAGLASVRVDAQRRIYRLHPEGLREVDAWLAPYRPSGRSAWTRWNGHSIRSKTEKGRTGMDAKLEKNGPMYTLGLERRLAHPPEKVWRVLTERELLKQWFPCDVEGEWKPGAKLVFTFLHGEGEGLPEEDLRGEVLTVDPPRLLEYRWGKHVLRCELIAEKDGCRLLFSESFADPSWGARNAAGWEMCLENLDLLLQGAALARFAVDVWQKKFARYVKKFEPEMGPQQGMPETHPAAAGPEKG